MGIMADYNDIFTSGQAAGIYLKSLKKSPCVYVMGTLSLKKELADMNIDVRENVSGDIEYFLAGYDTELTYQKLKDACDLLYEGIPFYATNPDLVCPAKKGRYLPDCASVCSMLTNATGREPFYIGKPRRERALVAVESRHKKNGDAVKMCIRDRNKSSLIRANKLY